MDNIPFVGGAYTLRSVDFDCQRCVNFYPILDEKQTGKDGNAGYLTGTPGLRLAVSGLAGVIRCIYTTSTGLCFCVAGDKFYSISNTYSATVLGTLSTSLGVVNASFNGVQLMLVDGTYGYIYNTSSLVFAQVTDPDMPNASHIVLIDSYFILNEVGTGNFWLTALNDGSNIDGLDFTSVDGSPNALVAIASVRKQLVCFGSRTTQFYYDSGDALTPFQQINGAFMDVGCLAKYSVLNVSDTLIWLGQDSNGVGQVYMLNGYQAQPISTNAINYLIQSHSNLDGAIAWSYQQDGSYFYCLNLSDTTICYDLSTGEWHERATWGGVSYSRWLINNHAFFNNVHLVGDYSTGKIYFLEKDTYTDNGAYIRRLRTSPHIASGLNTVFYDKFQLDLEGGVGLSGGQGSAPLIMMRYSNDGGHSWSNQRQIQIGELGNYKKRVIFLGCGSSRNRVFEVSITDPVNVNILGAYVEAGAGRS